MFNLNKINFSHNYNYSHHNQLSQCSNNNNKEKLIRYPLQNLHDTLQRFLKSVKPIVSQDVYQNTVKCVKIFSQPNGIGERLQKLLQINADKYENWLVDTKWWNNFKYLHNRKSIVTNTSPGIYWPIKYFVTPTDWLNYAAQIIESTLNYKEIIDRNQLPSEKFGEFLLDMSQYENIFGACRVPGVNVDRI